ncbi:hypothetical protein MBLNU230_g7397t1 [Neophaeotheca triangularis]
MSTTHNVDAVANKMPTGGSGEFHSKREGDGPQTTHGHKPGVNVGNDAVPEFNAKTLPPGSAPASNTFRPNNSSEVPPIASHADASSTLGGATSGDVNTGMGKPMQGQTSQELHDNSSDKQGGVEGRGGQAQAANLVDPHDPAFASQRALNKDDAKVGRSDIPAAEERIPEGAQTVAQENKLTNNTDPAQRAETGGSK